MSGQSANQLQLKRVLLVDDDPLVLRMYQERLVRQGVPVDTASDGLAAINSLRASRPDVVVLDLMMPKLSGVDVLKFIRSQPELKTVPVVVLSNSYMNELAAEASALGVQKALLKIRCSPALLLATIQDVLAGKSSSDDISQLLAVPNQIPPTTPSPAQPSRAGPASPAPAPAKVSREASSEAADFEARARRSFLQSAPATCTAMRSLCQAFTKAPNEAERDLRLQTFYRKIHFVAATAGLAGCHRLAQMASGFEALLFELIGKPALLTPSVLRTIAATVDFLALLFDHARGSDFGEPLSAQVLVVDDDSLNNRLVVTALQRARLHPRSTDDPLVGLQWLKETHFDLVLLDIEMPGMDGFELCRRLRLLPGHQKTPVIYVTHHADFESRAKSVLSGADDLISKPVFPIELAVKAVNHLLKSELARQTPTA
jgi:CheY-like chemotaxis protein